MIDAPTKTLKPWESRTGGAYDQEASFAAAQEAARDMLEWLDAVEGELKVLHLCRACKAEITGIASDD